MEIDITLWVLIAGIVIGWLARAVWARKYTISTKTPAVARAALQTLSAALADGKVTPAEVAEITDALIRIAKTLTKNQDL